MTAPRPLGYWVKTVDRMLDEQFEAQAEASGLSRREWQLLNRLHTAAVSEGWLNAAMAPYLAEGETLAEPLDRLRSARMVESQSGEHRLTDAGAAKVEEVQQSAVAAIGERVMDGLSPDDYDHLIRTLERIAQNLGWQPT